ncbi:glycosyltransferase [Actinocorallia libanotica]|uniref:Glycosyltransferase subfamily 4-like N-terminal domain-containing protein n=1 Tax=Actinocorallia libanotica TaxID=46162 RepID=A0ABP4CBS3_9ACTN
MRLLAFPRDDNPYQELLYTELRRHGVRVRYLGELTPSRTLNVLLLPLELAWQRLRGARLVHLHWVWGFRLHRPDIARWWFMAVLATIALLGQRLVWTAHNVLPHSPVFDDDTAARRFLVRRADLVILHDAATRDALRRIGAEPRHDTVIPHGPYPAPPMPDRPPGEPRTFLFFGRIEPYKGVEELLTAFADVPGEARLVVAGDCPDRERAARLHAAADERVELRLGHVPENEIAALMAEADVVVLPFRAITTSGSALMALSHGRPLVVPDHDTLAELPAVRYDGTVPALTAALTALSDVDAAVLHAGRRTSLAYARRTGWPRLAQATHRELTALLERPRRPVWRTFLRDALLRGSTLLLANTVALAVLGFAFWTLAARRYPPADVGRLAAVVAAVNLLAAVAALGLPNTLLRHLASAPRPRLLAAAAVAVVGTAGAALAAPAFLAWAASPLQRDLDPAPGTVALVVALVVATAAGSTFDAGLIAVRATGPLLAKNITGSLLKLAALWAAPAGAAALVAAYGSGTAAACLLGGLALLPRLTRGSGPAGLRDRLGFSLRSHLGTVLGILPSTVVPLQILAVLGAEPAAWSAVAFQIAAFLTFIPAAAGQVLFAESRRASRRRNLTLALLWTYGLLLPAVALTLLAAPVLLGVFGPSYAAEAAGALRLLALSALVGAGNYLVDALLIAEDRTAAFTFANGANAVLVLAAVAVCAPHGLTAAAGGWALAQAASLLIGAALLAAGRHPSRKTRT